MGAIIYNNSSGIYTFLLVNCRDQVLNFQAINLESLIESFSKRLDLMTSMNWALHLLVAPKDNPNFFNFINYLLFQFFVIDFILNIKNLTTNSGGKRSVTVYKSRIKSPIPTPIRLTAYNKMMKYIKFLSLSLWIPVWFAIIQNLHFVVLKIHNREDYRWKNHCSVWFQWTISLFKWTPKMECNRKIEINPASRTILHKLRSISVLNSLHHIRFVWRA